MGLVELAKVLAVEGEASGIQCNVIVPMAISRLTQDLIPPGMYACVVTYSVSYSAAQLSAGL